MYTRPEQITAPMDTEYLDVICGSLNDEDYPKSSLVNKLREIAEDRPFAILGFSEREDVSPSTKYTFSHADHYLPGIGCAFIRYL